MKKLLALFVLSASCLAQEIPDHPDKLKYKESKFEVPDAAQCRSVLSNGMVVYAIEDATLPLVDIRAFVRAGSFWQPKDKMGLAELCGTVMRTGGTKSRAPKDLDDELDFLAANVGVAIGETEATVSLSALSKDLNAGLAIFADVMRNPEFRQEKLDLARAQALDSLKARNDNTASIEAREANLLLYGKDYPVNAQPTKASIESLTREDLKAFHATFFFPSNIILAAAGNFHRAELLKKLEEVFKDWPNAEKKPGAVPPATFQPVPGVYGFAKDEKNITQGRVTAAHMGIGLFDPDAYAIRIMNYILGGGGFSSHLMQRVRTDEGLAYDVRSVYVPGIQYLGTFRVQFQSKNESCAFALKICLEEIEKLRTREADPKEVDAAKRFYLDAFPALFFSTRMATASTFAQAEMNGYPKDYYRKYRDRIAAVTPADVLRVAKERVSPEKFVIVCVGNVGVMEQGDGKHAVKLSSFGPVKMVPLPNPETLERTQ